MAALPTFNAGTDPTAAQWQTLLPKFINNGSDQTVNNSATLVNASGLVWALPANTLYEYTLRIFYNTNTTANFKWALSFPGIGRADFGISGLLLGGTNTVDLRAFNNYGTGTAIAVAGSANDAFLFVTGTVNVGASPANFQFQFAQNTANASNTILRGSSNGTLRQVA